MGDASYGRAHKEPSALLFLILLVGEGLAAGLVPTVNNLAHHTFFGQNVKEPVRMSTHLDMGTNKHIKKTPACRVLD